jgi:hypothetical protein
MMSIHTKSMSTSNAAQTVRRMLFFLLVIFCLLLSSCSSDDSTSAPPSTQSGSTSPGATSDPSDPDTTPPTEAAPDEPDVIQTKWENSSHASTFVVTEGGVNSKCARCHAPFNFIPTMDDMPESCATCKFEVDPPPPFTSEADWIDIECKVCHKYKRNKIEPGFAWLEIAPIEEYAEVSSSTELCDKCHLAGEVEGHFSIIVMGEHGGYLCTDCHDAHDTIATCSSSGCHEATLEADLSGHDADHSAVSCLACHDSGEMEIGILEETGTWFTFLEGPEGSLIPAASHNIVLAAPCERCHFEENPWGLVGSVSGEPE